MSSQIITVGYLKDFTKLISNITINPNGRLDSYCPTYKELTSGNLITYQNESDKLTIDKNFVPNVNYLDNQLVKRESLTYSKKEITIETISKKMTVSAYPQRINYNGGTVTISSTYEHIYKEHWVIKDNNGTPISQGVSEEYKEIKDVTSLADYIILYDNGEPLSSDKYIVYSNGRIQFNVINENYETQNYNIIAFYNNVQNQIKQCVVTQVGIPGDRIDYTKATLSIDYNYYSYNSQPIFSVYCNNAIKNGKPYSYVVQNCPVNATEILNDEGYKPIESSWYNEDHGRPNYTNRQIISKQNVSYGPLTIKDSELITGATLEEQSRNDWNLYQAPCSDSEKPKILLYITKQGNYDEKGYDSGSIEFAINYENAIEHPRPVEIKLSVQGHTFGHYNDKPEQISPRPEKKWTKETHLDLHASILIESKKEGVDWQGSYYDTEVIDKFEIIVNGYVIYSNKAYPSVKTTVVSNIDNITNYLASLPIQVINVK